MSARMDTETVTARVVIAGHGAVGCVVAGVCVCFAVRGAESFGIDIWVYGEAESAFEAAFGGDFGGVGGADATEADGADRGFAEASITEATAALKAGGAGFAGGTVSKATAKGGACGGLEANALGSGIAGFSGSLAGALPQLDANGFGAGEADTIKTTFTELGCVDFVFGCIDVLASSVLFQVSGPATSASSTRQG